MQSLEASSEKMNESVDRMLEVLRHMSVKDVESLHLLKSMLQEMHFKLGNRTASGGA